MKKPLTAKLNRAGPAPFPPGMSGHNTITPEDLEQLTERWILTFLEGPAIADPDLMRRVLDEHEETGG